MTGWKISPEGVQGVLEGVAAAAGTLTGALDGVTADAQSAVTGSGDSAVVADAVLGFLEAHRPTAESIGNRMNAACSAAAAATTAYCRGDEEMAAEQQAAALSLASSGAGGPL